MGVLKSLVRVAKAANLAHADKQKTTLLFKMQQESRLTEKRTQALLTARLSEYLNYMQDNPISCVEIEVSPECIPYLAEVMSTLDGEITPLAEPGFYLLEPKEEQQL